MEKMTRRLWTVMAALALGGFLLSGCPDVGQDPPVEFGYETDPVAIYNPDWGVLPLANNLLNPVQQAQIPVNIPGAPVPDAVPTTVDLPVVDAAEAEAIQALGYPVEPDSELTLQLKAGMNKLDGFVPGFVIRIPLSQPLDTTSLVPFDAEQTEDGLGEGNAADANFFFLDITDKENPQVIKPDDYFRIFNLERSEQYPYYLTLRLDPAILLPRDYQPGHTYLVVMTGMTEKGVKNTDGEPFWPDTFQSLFASTDPFIAADGSLRVNVVSDLVAAYELEGARQIINYGLEIWESVVGETHARNEVVSAFHFSITSNPMPQFFNPVNAVQPNANPFRPSPVDYTYYDADYNTQVKDAEACLTTPVSFALNMEVDLESIDSDAVALYKIKGDNSYEAVDFTINAQHGEAFSAVSGESEPITQVTLTPSAALDADSEYMVAVNGHIKGGPNDRPMVDEVYFGLTRTTTPLIVDGAWQSPYLDSRVDTLILNGTIEDISADDLAAAEESMRRVLTLLEATRKRWEPHMSWLVTNGFVFEREDITLFYTFSTGTDACSDAE